MQTTGVHRDVKDQFYTLPSVAKDCVDILKTHVSSGTWIEPSAGNGSFLPFVPGATAYDIDPKCPGIVQADFLSVELPDDCIVFGNPPFGRQASSARAFIRHAAAKACVIGFVLPRSFMKPSMQSAFPPRFHLVHQHELPANSFSVNEKPYDVPCVFQIWKKEDQPRDSPPLIQRIGFTFVKKSEPHDLAFRRVGINAGKCSAPADHSYQSHYFVKLDNPSLAASIIEKSLSHAFPSNTTGPRSLSKPEATEFLHACIADAGT